MQNPVQIPLSLYIHIPFCAQKCPYCDFNSAKISFDEQAYLAALIDDLRRDVEIFELNGRQIKSIFFGGGTPSLFSTRAIAEILQAVGKIIDIAENCEITLEANPNSAEVAKFAAYRQAGINRISIGVQSFSDKNLKVLGRIHSSAEAKNAILAAEKAGFSRINTDLIFALPNQNIETALSDLRAAADYGIEHISWYQLTIEEGTAFFRAPPANLPDEEEIADIFDSGREFLTAQGFEQYEISAWTRNKKCRHNQNYWQFGDYIGIGAGAHGKISQAGGIFRTEKFSAVKKYLACSGKNLNPYAAAVKKIEKDAQVFEFMLNALRLKNGVPRRFLSERTNLTAEEIDGLIQDLIARGLLANDRDFYRTTEFGFNHLNIILEEFIPN
ncbi:MAG: radical SAM family heme chaperone HemW [Cardiobacteriaceae bacterium]|nr:radical SAM family heme chaperone HemW [Cardiobacteriaceae bacterium]